MQQVVSLQEAVQRAEDGAGAEDVEGDGPASGQEGVDEAPETQEQEDQDQDPPGLG